MAEVGIAASVLGVASFGVRLTLTLYDFGATASAARAQTDRVARNVTHYSNLLELLGERLEDDKRVHSEAALDFIEELSEDSRDLFKRIKRLLPSREHGQDQISLIEKVKWNFKKPKV